MELLLEICDFLPTIADIARLGRTCLRLRDITHQVLLSRCRADDALSSKAIFWALERGQTAFLKAVLENGANPNNIRWDTDKSPLTRVT